LVAEGLAGLHVGHVQFHHRDGQHRQCIADGVAVVGPGTGVDEHSIGALQLGPVDTLAHRALIVGLEAFQLRAQFLAERLEPLVDLGQRDRAVEGRLALAEHVEIDAMKHEDLHRPPLCRSIAVYKGGPLAVDASARVAQPPGRSRRIGPVGRKAEGRVVDLLKPEQGAGGRPLAPA
jgi:hypothetical protein